jgi:hypothetical protein
MTQALNAHMNNKRKRKKKKDAERLTQTVSLTEREMTEKETFIFY